MKATIPVKYLEMRTNECGVTEGCPHLETPGKWQQENLKPNTSYTVVIIEKTVLESVYSLEISK